MDIKEKRMKFRGKLLTVGLVAGGALGALAVTNKIIAARAGVLDTALPGEEGRFAWKYGDVFYKVKGNRDASPLLFERLVLVTPSTTMLQETAPGPINAVQKFVLRSPIIGRFIYNLLTRRSTIRAFSSRRGYYNAGLITDQ